MLLLDEPLGALDLKLREEMQVELKRIQRDLGITFVYVTHDQEEALTMSDRLAVFNRGRIEQVGAPAEVYEHPATRVRRRLRRRLERARAGRPALHGPARRRSGCSTPSEAAEAGRGLEAGRIREVVYVGMVTRYLVELDGGGELTSSARTSRPPPHEALEERGRRVRLEWRPGHTFAIDAREGGETRMSTRRRIALWAAGRRPGRAACPSSPRAAAADDDERRRRRGGPTSTAADAADRGRRGRGPAST